MNSNVIEIVTILVQKLMHDEDLLHNEEEIIQTLVDMGYNLKDIEVAFELIFSPEEIIGLSEEFENHTYLPNSERILSTRERFAFSNEAQAILLKLIREGFIDHKELEGIIQKGAGLHSFNLGVQELWSLLKSTLRNKLRLTMIKKYVSAFQNLKDDDNLWIH